ncbi:FKBP-type peptidyl-prolyl cis-trans isomerase [Kamptonema cortianum]|nr:FKBP-type peptidyl-prolyl cis-trans isomerase [Geitlerinema splendidum]MDK3158505.1 FKBP-type peptidyl-prolyl cis-trans isomerase [Kamptonema cortianum]
MKLSLWVGACACLAVLIGCGPSEAEKIKAEMKAAETAEVKITEIVEGTGPQAKEGDVVYVLYRGTFAKDGKQFDTNMDDVKNQLPFSFTLGMKGAVIEGWQKGLDGMKQGGTRKLEIPSVLAYGSRGQGDKIPPDADLNFEVKLLYVFDPKEPGAYNFEDTTVGTGPEAKLGDHVEIHYRGEYLTGKRWDDTRERGKSVSFKLTEDSGAIPGLRDGIVGMKAGGKRTLLLPHTLVFGQGGSRYVQGGQPVRIEVELLAVNGQKG